MPSPFFIIEEPLKEKGIYRLAANEQSKRQSLLSSLPQTPGTFVIEFPNGKCYCGKTSNIQKRVERLLTQLLPTSRSKKLLHGNYTDNRPKWLIVALSENEINSISDLNIFCGEVDESICYNKK